MTDLIAKGGVRYAVVQPQQPGVRIRVPDSYRPQSGELSFAWDGVLEVARRVPASVAVTDGSIHVTYSELVDRARSVAQLIGGHVEGTSAPVALVMENGVDLIAAILGTLAAGQVYMPLDPTAPPARLAHILEHSGARLLLTTAGHAQYCSAAADGRVPVAFIEDVPDLPDDLPAARVGPTAPARLVYTSGSTGDPKGVARSQQDLVDISMAQADRFYISSSDRVALLAPLSFGMANGILWNGLLGGATVCFYDVRKQGLAGLPDWVVEKGITYMSLVPSVFRALCAVARPGVVFADVRFLRLGGDRVVAEDMDLFRVRFGPDALVANSLSCSEVGSIADYCANRDTEVGDVFPVGYPTRPGTVLLDAAGNEVGDHTVGEVVVWREAVLGYWNDSDQSDNRFVPDPAGGFRFHTGDLAMRRADGCLEYVGRKDFRVKVDGQAVEVAEVEDALVRCAGIDEAIVVGVEDHSGVTRLVAYARGSFEPADRVRIRAKLAESLPPYMVPATLMKIEVMPTSVRGKVDRAALPAPAWATFGEAGGADTCEAVRRAMVGLSGVRSAVVVDAPTTGGSTELTAFYVRADDGVRSVSVRRALKARLPANLVPSRLVAVDELPADGGPTPDPHKSAIPPKLDGESSSDLAYSIASFFEDVLGATVGLDESFLDLGGTSLQTMSVFGKIDATYGVNLSPTTIVDAPTPRAIADVVQGHRFRTRSSALVPLRAEGSRTATFHVHGGRGHVLHLHGLTQYAHPDRPMYGFEQPGLHGRARPLRTVERMAAAYVSDLRSVRPHGPYALMGHSFGGMVALEMARLLVAAGEEVKLLVIFDTKFSHVARPPAPQPQIRRRRPRQVLSSIKYGLLKWTRGARAALNLRLGRPVPYFRRTRFFFEVHIRAAKKYRPRPYSGRVLIIAEEGSSAYHEEVWGGIAPGNFEIVELPVRHGQLIEEPYIVDVMREVEARIDA